MDSGRCGGGRDGLGGNDARLGERKGCSLLLMIVYTASERPDTDTVLEAHPVRAVGVDWTGAVGAAGRVRARDSFATDTDRCSNEGSLRGSGYGGGGRIGGGRIGDDVRSIEVVCSCAIPGALATGLVRALRL